MATAPADPATAAPAAPVVDQTHTSHSASPTSATTTAHVPPALDTTVASAPATAPTSTSATSPQATSPQATLPPVSENAPLPSTSPSTQPFPPVPQSANDDVNPPDFQGEVATNNDLPSSDVIRKIQDYTVLDRHGKTHPFKSLYSGHNVARRVLVIFIRHFFCGNCQEYIRSLSPAITPESLLALPVSTFIVVIGCGSHELIDTYINETGCPFDVYADPTRRLYDKLGMIRTLQMGQRPAYMQNKTMAHTVVSGVMQGLKQIKSGLVLKMGDQRQVGGEFLFEPASMSLESPIATPHDEPRYDPLSTTTTVQDPSDLMMNGSNTTTEGSTIPNGEDCNTKDVEEKRVTWCHRMKTTRDHAEIPELMEVLGLSGVGTPMLQNAKKRNEKNEARWSKAINTRKGTGLSLASQMSRMSMDAKVPPSQQAESPVAISQPAANGNGAGAGNEVKA